MKGLVCLAIAAVLAGCTTWRTEALEPARFRVDTLQAVRLVLRRGYTVTVRSAAIRDDTVVGVQGDRQVRVPLSDVERAEVQEVSSARSLALIGVVGGLMVWAAYEAGSHAGW